MNATIISLAFLLSAQVQQAPPVRDFPNAPPIIADCECPLTGICACKSCICIQSYTGGIAKSVKDGKPLVVFVGCEPRPIPGMVVARRGSMAGYPAKCIVVSVPIKGDCEWKCTLGVNATNAQIKSADHRGKEASQPTTDPFRAVRATSFQGCST